LPEIDRQPGDTLIGLIATEDTHQVTVRMPGGLETTFPRREVAAMRVLGRSLMPEGLEAALSMQAMADLLAHIAGDR
jgi:putative heme-binding domain-containing protein